jgi:hypothetical protein
MQEENVEARQRDLKLNLFGRVYVSSRHPDLIT